MTELSKQLKVLHIISGDLWAGAEVQAYTLLSRLDRMVDLHVVIMNPGELERRLIGLKVRVTVIDEARHNSLMIFLKLREIICRIQPDVIHTHRTKENILGSLANIFSSGAVSLRTVHGAPERAASGVKALQAWLDSKVGSYLQSAIIAVSSDLADKLSVTYDRKKIVTILNGIDEEVLTKNIKEADFKTKFPVSIHVGIVGRIESVKRIDVFLQTAALLVKKSGDNNWLFHVFGDGSLLQEMRALAKELVIEDRVIFHGHRMDIHNCMASLDMMLMCSDHEGLPMAALEAMALGTPLIAHNVGGLVEVLSNRPEQLINEHTAEGYYKGVMLLLGKHNGNNELPEKFKASVNAERVYGLYSKLNRQRAI